MTSTTIEKNYTTNSIIKDWLTLKAKLNKDKLSSVKIDYDKFNVTIEA